ncbi:hypothetical protein [Dokdonia sp.]|uniref:hypothetical protein n=1 Tax=Dokdonia sp. TaxID=2024995 RepID=UPI0032645EF6
MKKISYYLSLLLVLTTITFISCDDEQLEGEFFPDSGDSELLLDKWWFDSDDFATDLFFSSSGIFQQRLGTTEGSGTWQYIDEGNGLIQVNDVNTPGQLVPNFIVRISDLQISTMTAEISVNEGDTFSNSVFYQDTDPNPNPDPDPDPSSCDDVTAIATNAQVAFENATPDNELALCNAYRTALEAQITACGDADGSIQAIIDGLNCMDPACATAITATEDALAVFNMTDIADEMAYVEACGNYSLALQEQIIACGDEDGSLQAIVDELGDCSIPEDDGPVRMTIDGEFKNFNVAEAPINGSTFEVTATDIDTTDTFEFTVVLQQTGENIIQGVVLTIDGVAFLPVLNGDPQFMSEITQNDGVMIVGTFSGPMMNADGDVITITGGIINIEI